MALASSLAPSAFSPLSLRSSSLPPLPLPSPSPRLLPPCSSSSPFLSRPSPSPSPSPPSHVSLGGSALAGALFAALASSDSALAAQQIVDLAADDNRGLALLIPLVPAVAWVLFNILKPALSQFDKMKGAKGVAVGLGLGAGTSLLASHHASAAQELANLAADSDSRGLLLLGVLIPAVGWVLFNILKPALSQFDKMKGLVGAIGLGAASMVLASQADAAVQELASVADSDNRGLLVLFVLVPAVGWVLFNILRPALSQLDKMRSSKSIAGAIGLGTASAIFSPQADAAVQEIANIADNDLRGPLLLGILIPALAWVLFNILQPGLSQLDKMRTGK